MKKILTSKISIESAMRLRDIIKNISGKHFSVTKDVNMIGNDGVLIRYGNSQTLPEGVPDTEFNTSGFCRIAAHKGEFSLKMADVGLPAPIFSKVGEPRDYPVVVRSTLTGYQGAGITLCKDKDEFLAAFKNGYWWTPYIRTSYEVRAYVAGGEITRTFYKLPFMGQQVDEYPIRSGYHYSLVDHTNRFTKLKEVCCEIARSMNGKFFAVDSGWREDSKEYVVFELNSGPGMSVNTASNIAYYLVRQLGLLPD